MPLENHSLVQEFPQFRDRIHQLKTSDTHFARLFAKYDAVEHEVHKLGAEAEAGSDERTESLKKKRLSLKDQLFELLQKSAA